MASTTTMPTSVSRDNPSPPAASSSSLQGKGTYRQSHLPVRYVILALVLLATSIEYVCRYNINVSIVAMVHSVNHTGEEHLDTGCPLPEAKIENGTIIPLRTGSYDWDATTQGVILGGEADYLLVKFRLTN